MNKPLNYQPSIDIVEQELEEDLVGDNCISKQEYEEILYESKLKEEHPDSYALWEKLGPFNPTEPMSVLPDPANLESYEKSVKQSVNDPVKKVHSIGQYRSHVKNSDQHGF